MESERKLTAVARSQSGYFTSRQALAAGYSNSLQGYHARSGNWLRVDRGLFRLPGYPDTSESELIRWSLWAGGQAARQVVVSHASALHYYGLCAEKPGAVELTVSDLRHDAQQSGCRLHLERLEKAEVVRKRGFALTSPERTLRDMRPDLTFRGLWPHALRQAMSGGLLDEEALGRLGGIPAEMLSLAGQAGGEEQTMAARWRSPVLRMAGCGAGGSVMRGATGGMSRCVNRSFTLVEMLVVISIIAILAALLIPSMRTAMNMSYAVSCINNYHQFGTALHSYASDSSNILPPINPGNSWATIVYKEFWPNLLVRGGYASTSKWYNENYGYSRTGMWRCPSVENDMMETGGGAGILESGTHMFGYGKPVRMSAFRFPSRRIVMGDARFAGSKRSLNAFFCPVCVPWDAGWTDSHEAGAWHDEGQSASILMLDGHAANMPYLVLFSNSDDLYGHYTR